MHIPLSKVLRQESRHLPTSVRRKRPFENDEAVRVGGGDVVAAEVVLEEPPGFRGEGTGPGRGFVGEGDPGGVLRAIGGEIGELVSSSRRF
jgi:hypothetical protein